MVKNEKTASFFTPLLLLRVMIFLPGLIGPVLSGRRYASVDGGDLTAVSWALFIPISIGYGASVVIAILVHRWVKDSVLAVLIAIPTCLFMYGALMIAAVLVDGDPEGLMWLPVILLFVGINGLPMAVVVPFFTISALRCDRLIKKSTASKGGLCRAGQ